MRLVLPLAIAVLIAGADAAGADPEEPRRITVDLRDLTLSSLAQTVSRQAGVRIEVAPSLASKRVSLSLEKATVEEVVRAAAEAAETTATRDPDGGWRIGEEDIQETWQLEALAKLEKRAPILKLDDAEIGSAVLKVLSGTDLPVQVDPEALRINQPLGPRVTLAAEGLRMREALDRVTAAAGLSWDLRWHGIFVASRERLRSVPRRLVAPGSPPIPDAIEAKLREMSITLNLVDTKMPDAIRLLDGIGPLSIRLDPSARSAAEEETVDLRTANMSVRQMLDLLLLPRGYQVTVKGETLIVRKVSRVPEPTPPEGEKEDER